MLLVVQRHKGKDLEPDIPLPPLSLWALVGIKMI